MTCRLCSTGFPAGEVPVAFSEFVVNELDPLKFFSGQTFHRNCLDRHEQGARALRRYQEHLKNTARGRRFCAICGERAESREDVLELPHLVDDAEHPLEAWNEALLHHACIPGFPERELLAQRLHALESSPRWAGAGLKAALARLD